MTDLILPRHFAKRPTPKYFPRLGTEIDDERPSMESPSSPSPKTGTCFRPCRSAAPSEPESQRREKARERNESASLAQNFAEPDHDPPANHRLTPVALPSTAQLH